MIRYCNKNYFFANFPQFLDLFLRQWAKIKNEPQKILIQTWIIFYRKLSGISNPSLSIVLSGYIYAHWPPRPLCSRNIEWRLKQHRRSFRMTDKKSPAQLIHFSLSLPLGSYGSMAWVGQSGLVHLLEMLDVPICWRDFVLDTVLPHPSSSSSSSNTEECEEMSKYKTSVPPQKNVNHPPWI